MEKKPVQQTMLMRAEGFVFGNALGNAGGGAGHRALFELGELRSL